MIKNTLDIVNRARELADLQNSDFIGWKENNNLLNEAYTKLYTELINHKDRFYIKSISPNDLELDRENDNERFYKLPEDFYMLNNITRGVNCEQILRKAPAESKTSYRYDIINNCLVLYGGVEQTDLTMEYWTIPETLSIKAPTKNIILPEGWTWCDCNDNKYAGYKYNSSSDITTIIVFDIKTGNSFTKDLEYHFSEAPDQILLGKKAFVTCGIKTEGEQSLRVYDLLNYHDEFETQMPSVLSNKIFFVGKSTNKVYMFAQQQNNDIVDSCRLVDLDELAAYDFQNSELFKETILFNSLFNENIYKDIISFTFKPYEKIEDLTELYFTKKTLINTIYVSNLYKLTDTEFENIKDIFTKQNTSPTTYFAPVFFNDNLYYKTVNFLYCNDIQLLDLENVNICIGVNKEDNSTGYGYSVIDYSGNVYVYSTLKDTEIEFPNNFYFQYLSYMLAIAYKAKQNADSTALKDQATEESRQFYNSISQDANQELRIKNVYNMGGWL